MLNLCEWLLFYGKIKALGIFISLLSINEQLKAYIPQTFFGISLPKWPGVVGAYDLLRKMGEIDKDFPVVL